MRIITLNTWGGRTGKQAQLDFFAKYGQSADIFCLQEIWSAPYEHLEGKDAGGIPIKNDNVMVYGKQEISKVLPDFETYFRPLYGDHYGLLMLVKKDLEVLEEAEKFVYKDRGYVHPEKIGNHARSIQYAKIINNTTPLTVINFHGLWNGEGKTDTPDRILQSQNIIDFIQTLKGDVVFCGDFNLLPTTESLQMFEQAGLRNLIKENGVTSTRTSHYPKPEKFADYIFTSPGVKVKEFKVLSEEVSDHNALSIEIE